MKTLNYKVKEVEITNITVEIENDDEIYLKTVDNCNISSYIGLIGKGEGNRYKTKIGVGEDYIIMSRMYGNPINNAIELLSKNKRNKVISKEAFILELNNKKQYLDKLNSII